jgi:hypothetical protein
MMKHTGSLALGLGLFVGLPAFTFGGGMPDSIEGALQDTLRALEALGELEQELTDGGSLPAGTVERITDAPVGTAMERSQKLDKLRTEVSELQAQVDAKRVSEGVPLYGPSATTEDGGPAAAPEGSTTVDTRGLTTGLPETFVRALGSGDQTPGIVRPSATGPYPAGPQPTGGQRNPGASSSEDSTTPASETTESAPSPEGRGYSAHPLRQAKACFRAGRYQQGVDILEAADLGTEGDYWLARCLTKLDRTAEAVALFQAVEVADDAGDLAAAAKREREFAEWLEDFEQRTGIETGAEADAQEPKQ